MVIYASNILKCHLRLFAIFEVLSATEHGVWVQPKLNPIGNENEDRQGIPLLPGGSVEMNPCTITCSLGRCSRVRFWRSQFAL
jgi:hypothetical protein